MQLGVSSLGFVVEHSIEGKQNSLIDILLSATEACLRFSEAQGFNICEILIDPPEIYTKENKKKFISIKWL